MRAVLLAAFAGLVLISEVACQRDFGLDELRFACTGDTDCPSDYLCHPQLRVCLSRGCGDGVLTANEACDDANPKTGDGCNDACAIEPRYACAGEPSHCTPCPETGPCCGDGFVEADEECEETGAGTPGCDRCRVMPGWICTGGKLCEQGKFRELSVGYAHACAITPADQVLCWGSNIDEETLNYSGQSRVPHDLANARHVSAGEMHTCTIAALDGTIRCFGDDFFGQSTPPADFLRADQISAGAGHTCGIFAGRPKCFGSNGAGQTTVPATITRQKQVTVGGDHSCSITGGGVIRCWGTNTDGETTTSTTVRLDSIDAGSEHTCGVTKEGTIHCWGKDIMPPVRTLPPPGNDFVEVSCSIRHCCARRAAGTIACWGDGPDDTESPFVPEGEILTSVSAGARATCGLRPDQTIACWGLVDIPQK